MNVVISTFSGRYEWVADCLASIPDGWAWRLAHGWELDVIYAACDDFDRFLFVQDSVAFIDPAQLEADIVAAPSDVALFPVGQSGYCGTYTAETVRSIPRPRVTSKDDAIYLETSWCRAYQRASRGGVLYPHANDAAGSIVEHHGRSNLMLDSGTVRKFKGTFCR